MLHDCKNTGTSRGHPYPKIMLSFLLILAHWRDTQYCGYQMMYNNMSVFNEELGELTFAILARSTLGDHTKDDFDHMDKLFRLLAVYRDVKSDVVADTNASNSLNWRHKINKDGEEVRNTELFFKSAILQMVNGTYTSYDGKAKGYSNSFEGAQHKVEPTNPAVYMSKDNLVSYVERALALVKDDMNTNYLKDYRHIWPECINDADDQIGIVDVLAELAPAFEEKKEELLVDHDDGQQLAPSEDDDVDLPSDATEEDSSNEGSDDGRVDPDQGAANGSRQISWNGWGRITSENNMVGKRNRSQVQRFLYNQRRRGGKFPTNPT